MNVEFINDPRVEKVRKEVEDIYTQGNMGYQEYLAWQTALDTERYL